MSPPEGFILEPDRGQIARFVEGAFRHVEEGGIISLRAFYDDELAKKRNDRPFDIVAVKLNGRGHEPIVEAAFALALEAAKPKRPVVVAPPIATFRTRKADEKNLLEGPLLSLELDERAAEAVAKLRAILGPPTFVVASGGEWLDPETGEVEPKLHAHWRLKEPAVGEEEHRRLKRLRTLACELVEGDGTSKTTVHPMRWPGTLHRKNPDRPRLACLIEENADAEIVLDDALGELEGIESLRRETANRDGPRTSGDDPTGDDALLMQCVERIPNDNLPWERWNYFGLALWRASGGSEGGFAAFDHLSRKSAKYDPEATRARWDHFATSPPDRIGIGTLVWEARRTDPDFRKRKSAELPSDGAFPGAERERFAEGSAPGNDWETELAAAIDEMNRRYFVAQQGGRALICSLAYDDALGRERLVFSRKEDVKLLFNHRHYQTGSTAKGNPVWKDLGTAWIEDWRRRTYDRLALLPNAAAPPGVYNLWRGWGVEPKAGDWPLFRDHLLKIVCAGDRASLDYLIGWCATCVQHPERHAEVAVVLRGEKGAGKGTVAQALMRIFRDHALQVVNAKHLTGHFNAHLADVLFLFLDEAFWGGDKQGEGVLKALITERQIMIEPKGVDSFSMPNRLKIVMASNNDWVVPATADERRYFVLDVGNERRGDLDYFTKLHRALDEGELAAFFDHLLKLDLSGFNVRAVPHTKGLNRQKLVGADSVTAFWYDCLCAGSLEPGVSRWPEDVVTQVLHALYLDHARDHGERHPVTDARMVERLEELWAGCGVRRVRPRKEWNGIERPQRYAFGSLEQHREAFLRAMRIDPSGHEWPRVEEAADEAG